MHSSGTCVHFHGSYGVRHPDPAYPFGVRVKRLPDWNPADGLREDIAMTWILVDRDGRRFMNEYDPYMQDTGHRALEHFDPVRQRFPRVPSLMLVDAKGRERYPLSAPTWNDAGVAAKYRDSTPRDFDARSLTQTQTLPEIAAKFDIDPAALERTVAAWNEACGRRPGRRLWPTARQHGADRHTALLGCRRMADRLEHAGRACP